MGGVAREPVVVLIRVGINNACWMLADEVALDVTV